MSLAIFLMALFFAGLVWFIGEPLFVSAFKTADDSRRLYRHHLESRKTEVIGLLKDLKLDRDMNKMSEPEFKELYDEAFSEGTRLLQEIDEADVAPAPDTKHTFCTQCGSAVKPQDKFCAQCGEKVHVAS